MPGTPPGGLTWPEILGELPDAGPVCIEASAGTGKTYTLEHLILKLVVSGGVPLERVLMVTFTEKAARELRERVRERLHLARAQLAPGKASGKAPDDAPAEALDDASRDPEAERGLARRRIDAALRAFDRASIRTIHGFCQEVLGDGALPAGLLLEQRLVDRRLLTEPVLREVVRERLDADDPLGFALRAFLTAHGLPALLELHHAVSSQQGEIVPPWNLGGFRALAATAPSRDDLEAWIERKGLPRAGAPVKALFVEGFSTLPEIARALDTEIAALAPDNPWQRWCAETGEGKKARIKVFESWLEKPKVRADPFGQRLFELFLALRASPLSPGVYLVHHLFAEVKAKSSARKVALGLLDYDDMLTLLAKALEGPDGERLADTVRARFSWVLIDEFQDTDALQWGIFTRIFGDPSTPRPEHRMVVVGDPKQAIYGFRGGDLPVYLEARRQIARSGNAPLHLKTSYRATPTLLAALGPVFAEGYFHDEDSGSGSEASSEADGSRVCAPPLLAGRPDDSLVDAEGKTLAPVLLLSAPDDQEQVGGNKAQIAHAIRAAITDEIRRLCDPAAPASFRHAGEDPRPLRPGDCMVLSLTGRQSEAMGDCLAAARIPHAFFKREGLSHSPEADALRLLLEALAAPDDPSARARLWLSPFFELPLAKIEAARALPSTHPLNARVDRLCALAAERHFEALFEEALVETGLLRRLALTRDERALTNYQHLCEQLVEAARTEPLTLDDLRRRLCAGQITSAGGRDHDLRRLETERDAVTLLTLHAAKGLEAPVVFLAFSPVGLRAENPEVFRPWSPLIFHEGSARRVLLSGATLNASGGRGQPLPEAEARAREEAEAERRRLFYVAATRPMARLLLPVFPTPAEGPAKKPLHYTPGYAALEARLLACAATPALAPLFEDRPLAPFFGAELAAPASAAPPLAPTIPDPAATLRADSAALFELRATRRAPVMTSYSRMKRGADDLPPTDLGPTALLANDEDAQAFAPAALLPEDPALPGGVATGLFLHTLLEELSFEQVAGVADAEELAACEPLRRRAARLADRHGLPSAAARRGLELTFHALRTPWTLGALTLSGGLCAVDRHRAELPFVYPLPEISHPLGRGGANATPREAPRTADRDRHRTPREAPLRATGGAADAPAYRVERGFVTGIIDLVFEHEGRVYFLDWKSDRLPDYGPDVLARHVQQHYALQARLYTLAVTRLFGLCEEASYDERFGGLAYLFLRAAPAEGDPAAPAPGLHFERPSFADLGAWESELLGEGAQLPGLDAPAASPRRPS